MESITKINTSKGVDYPLRANKVTEFCFKRCHFVAMDEADEEILGDP